MLNVSDRPRKENALSSDASVSLQGWPVPSDWPSLALGEVHVWRVSLDCSDAEHDQLWPLLAPEEQERAARFAFAELRRRFAIGRGRLRLALGSYLDCRPSDLTFRYAPRGKPHLDAPSSSELEFNVSHAEKIALFAFSRAGPVGVDIERIRPLTSNLWALAEEHFTPAEVRQLRVSSPDEQLTAFYRGWTRKEALIKADGQGLAHPLNQVEVGLGERCNSPVCIPPNTQPRNAWCLYPIAPGTIFIGALAAPIGAVGVSCFAWP